MVLYHRTLVYVTAELKEHWTVTGKKKRHIRWQVCPSANHYSAMEKKHKLRDISPIIMSLIFLGILIICFSILLAFQKDTSEQNLSSSKWELHYVNTYIVLSDWV